MILEEYNEDLHIKNEKEISFSTGYNMGDKQGFERGDKQGFERGDKQGFERGDKQGFERGDKQGYARGKKQGQDSLALTIIRLKNGDDIESIMADGIDPDTVELAKQCL